MRFFAWEVRLVDDAKHWWRWASMRAMALDTAFLTSWALMPDDLKAGLPSWLVPMMGVIVLVFGMAGRVVKQVPPEETNGKNS